MMDKDLYKVIEYLLNRQQILTELLIHIGSRSGIYDEYIAEEFTQLCKLKQPNIKYPEE